MEKVVTRWIRPRGGQESLCRGTKAAIVLGHSGDASRWALGHHVERRGGTAERSRGAMVSFFEKLWWLENVLENRLGQVDERIGGGYWASPSYPLSDE